MLLLDICTFVTNIRKTAFLKTGPFFSEKINLEKYILTSKIIKYIFKVPTKIFDRF